MADYSYETFHQLLLEWKRMAVFLLRRNLPISAASRSRMPSRSWMMSRLIWTVRPRNESSRKTHAPAEDQDETLPMAEASEPGEDESDLEEALEKEFEKDSCPSGPASSAVPTAAAPTSQDRRGALAVCESGQPVKSEPGIPAPVSKAESAGLDHETSPKAEAKGAKPECADTLLDVKEPGSQSTAAAGGRLDKSRCH